MMNVGNGAGSNFDLGLVFPEPKPSDKQFFRKNKQHPLDSVKEVGTSTWYSSVNEPQDCSGNVLLKHTNDGFELTEYQAKPGGSSFPYEQQRVKQELSADGKTKVTTIRPKHNYDDIGNFEMVQTIGEDGTYECHRIGNRNLYDKKFEPLKGRKAPTGFKGLLEKFGMNIAQNANGCERPVLRWIGGAFVKCATKIK